MLQLQSQALIAIATRSKQTQQTVGAVKHLFRSKILGAYCSATMLKQQREKDAHQRHTIFSNLTTSAKHELCKAQGPLSQRRMHHPNMLYNGITNAKHDFNK